MDEGRPTGIVPIPSKFQSDARAIVSMRPRVQRGYDVHDCGPAAERSNSQDKPRFRDNAMSSEYAGIADDAVHDGHAPGHAGKVKLANRGDCIGQARELRREVEY